MPKSRWTDRTFNSMWVVYMAESQWPQMDVIDGRIRQTIRRQTTSPAPIASWPLWFVASSADDLGTGCFLRSVVKLGVLADCRGKRACGATRGSRLKDLARSLWYSLWDMQLQQGDTIISPASESSTNSCLLSRGHMDCLDLLVKDWKTVLRRFKFWDVLSWALKFEDVVDKARRHVAALSPTYSRWTN